MRATSVARVGERRCGVGDPWLYSVTVFALLQSTWCTQPSAVVWGPGLRGMFTMPVRYIFISLRDENGTRLQNVSRTDVSVELREASSGHVKEYQADLLRTGDTTESSDFLYRFRPYHAYLGHIILVISYKQSEIHRYTIEGPIDDEDCDCPVGLHKWLHDLAKCRPISPQILSDLQPFSIIRPDYNRRIVERFYDQPHSIAICNYVIKNNRVYRRCWGEYTGFNMFMDAILLSLIRKVKLPDVDFLVNLGDYPLAKLEERRYSPQIPIVSWCGSRDSLDIVLPTYELVEASVYMMRRVALDVFSVQNRAQLAFEAREPRAFWRGRDSREERLTLVELARGMPSLLNASLTNFFFFRHRMEQLGGKTPHISFFDFFKFRFQVNIDGTVAAYRLPFLLAGGSTVLKVDSPFYEHFYGQLEEGRHFIGVRADLSNLLDQVRYCLDERSAAHCADVARHGRRFVTDYLLPEHIYCYYTQLLTEYSRRIDGPVVVAEHMELVNARSRSEGCSCDREANRQRRGGGDDEGDLRNSEHVEL